MQLRRSKSQALIRVHCALDLDSSWDRRADIDPLLSQTSRNSRCMLLKEFLVTEGHRPVHKIHLLTLYKLLWLLHSSCLYILESNAVACWMNTTCSSIPCAVTFSALYFVNRRVIDDRLTCWGMLRLSSARPSELSSVSVSRSTGCTLYSRLNAVTTSIAGCATHLAAIHCVLVVGVTLAAVPHRPLCIQRLPQTLWSSHDFQ